MPFPPSAWLLLAAAAIILVRQLPHDADLDARHGDATRSGNIP